MKKLLAILGSLNIILTSSFTFTSCDIFIDKNNTPEQAIDADIANAVDFLIGDCYLHFTEPNGQITPSDINSQLKLHIPHIVHVQNKVISEYNPHLVTFNFLGKDIPPLADIINYQNNSLKVTIKYNQVAAKYQILVFLTVIF